MSVHMEQLGPRWTDFHEILYLKIFQKYADKIQLPLKSARITGAFVEGLCTIVLIFLLNSFVKLEMFLAKIVEKKHDFMFNNILYGNLGMCGIKECGKARQATHDAINVA